MQMFMKKYIFTHTYIYLHVQIVFTCN